MLSTNLSAIKRVSYLPSARKLITRLHTLVEPVSLCSTAGDSSRLVGKSVPGPSLSCCLLIVVIFEHPEKGPCFSHNKSAVSFPSAEEVGPLELYLFFQSRLGSSVNRSYLNLSADSSLRKGEEFELILYIFEKFAENVELSLIFFLADHVALMIGVS